ncbi:MAG TPA: LamG-like jellyroll fold domain-containing protein, partial [Actinomycetota bacterium]
MQSPRALPTGAVRRHRPSTIRRSTLIAIASIATLAVMLPLAPAAVAAGNQAVQLDGTNDAIQLGAGGGSPLGASTFTLELWFKRTGTGAATSTGNGGNTDSIPLITKGRGEAEGSNVDANYFLGIDLSSGELEADFEDTATGGNHPVNGATSVPMNSWHHGAVTFDGTQLCLYLDGVQDGSCTATTAVPRSDSIQIPAVGTAYTSSQANPPTAPAGFFAGAVDEVRIWNVARTPAQIQASMNTDIGSATAGLLGQWAMNEGAGTSAANAQGSAGINATLVNGPTWVAGAPALDAPPAGNYGLQMDGTNDYVTFGTAAGLGASQFTLELWFKWNGGGDTTTTGTSGIPNAIPLLTKGRGEADSASNVDTNYFLGIDASTGVLAADFEEGAGGTNPSLNHPILGTTAISTGVWHHAAATYDASGTWRLYLDGVLNGTLAVGQPPRSDSIQHAAIGSALTSNGTADGFFAGTVDEARIWNVARTGAEIQGAMGGEVTSGTGLIGRWGMNEGTGNSLGASVGPSGTLMNGPTWVAGTTFTPPNTAPVVDSVVIDQATPRTNDTLTAAITSHDAESNPVTYAYQWTKNGTDIAGATNASLDLATAGNGDEGDLIRLRVTASDASLTSAPLTSSPVTILNTAPTATVSLDDHAPGTNATLTA